QATGLCPGTYTDITIVGAATGCRAVWPNDINIQQGSSNIAVNASATDTGCNTSNGSATATASGGVAPYTYEWSNGQTGATINNVPGGTYGVTATDANGCEASTSVAVTPADAPVVVATCPSDPVVSYTLSNYDRSCSSGNNAFIAFTSSTAMSAILANNTSCSFNNKTRWGIVPGSATLFEEYDNGTALMQMRVQNVCDPSYKLNLTFKFAGRTFSAPSGSPALGASTNCVDSGTNTSDWYYYTSTEGTAVGEDAMVGALISFTRTGPAFQVGTGANQFDEFVPGASGWNDATILSQPTNGPGLVNAGYYDINVNLSKAGLNEEPDGCLVICAGESTEITAQAFAGTEPYTYNWSNGLGAGASKTVTPNTTTSYTVSVTDANGCTATDHVTVTVNPGPSLSLSKVDATCGENNGSVTANASGGTAPYNYAWTGNRTGATITDLGVGTYAVTVTDANGCTNTLSINLSSSDNPTATISGGGDLCSGNSHTFTAADQEAGATYSWNFGANASPATTTGPGPHSVTYSLPTSQNGNVNTTVNLTVTRDGCTATTSTTFTVLDTPTGTLSKVDPGCEANDGSITITFPDNPSRTGIEFSINNGGSWSNVGDDTGSYTFGNLAPGTYTVQSRWENGECPVTLGTITLDELGNVTDAGTISGDETQCGTYDPINITGTAATGGTGASITYRWQTRTYDCGTETWTSWSWLPTSVNGPSYNPGNITTTTEYRRAARRSDCPWQYTDAVRKNVTENITSNTITEDQYYCESGDATQLGGPAANGGCFGSVAYQWQVRPNTSAAWTDISGATQENYDPTSQVMTLYYRRLARRGNCPWVGSEEVVVHIANNFTDPGTLSSDETECGGFDPANITGTAPSGGQGGSVRYQWQISTGTSGSWTDINEATDANYNPGPITQTTQYRRGVRRTGGCPFIYSYPVTKTVVDNITTNTISASQTNCGPFDPPAFTAPAATGGGGATVLYQWQWRDGTSGTWVDLGTDVGYDPGMVNTTRQYQRLARRGTDCPWIPSDVLTLTIHPEPTASIVGNQTICVGESTTLSASGGSSYSWNSGSNNASITVSPGSTTTYTVTVTNGQGCTDTESVTVIVNPNPDAQITGSGVVCEGETTTLTATGANSGGTYAWSTGANTPSITVTPNGSTTSYSVTVTNTTGCSDVATISVTPAPNIMVSASSSEICSGQSTTLMAAGGASYQWSTDANDATSSSVIVNPTTTTTYSVTVTSSAGCPETGTVTVTVLEQPTATVDITQPTACVGADNGQITVNATGASAPLRYRLDDGSWQAN
ncbi:MAG: hypothetical protein AAGJ82_10455, partial [Bacteroidota bacterium]